MMAIFKSLVVVFSCVALIEGYKPGDKRDDKKPDKDGCKPGPCKDRDVELWQVKDNMVKQKASQKTETYSDYLDFQIKVGAYDGIDTNFKYYLNPKGADEKGKFDMSMKLFKIIEFKDAPGSTEGYDSGDEIVQEYVLGSPKGGKGGKKRGETWSPIEEATDPGNPDAKAFSAKTTDGVFEVIGRYAGKPVTFTKRFSGNGSTDVTYEYHLQPTNIKFDYIIRDFPFIAKDSTLALEGRFKSNARVKQHRSRKSAFEVPADDGDEAIHGMFTWASTVNIDGVETPVLSSLLSETTADDDNEEASKRKPGEKGMKSFWTFAHAGPASSFVWDPNLGVESADGEFIISGASGLSMCFLALLPAWALRINF